MIKRDISKLILNDAKYFPVIAILGPRQSGKTTLAQSLFSSYTYVSLEEPKTRDAAINDPRKFLKDSIGSTGVIIDEAQRAPDLFSYIQTYVDLHKKNGQIILTGSQNFLLMQSISQSLAGRIALNTLLPLSINELKKANLLIDNPDQVVAKGFYPRIFDEHLDPNRWFPLYTTTYLERDIHLIQQVTDLKTFQRFTALCAGRIGQILNLSSLANDCGISVNTAKGWLSLLETSYIVFLLYPHYKNFSKRLIKNPKLYFYDTGLACSLLNITDAATLNSHYLRGGLFECMIISDLIKECYNMGKRPWCFFWRDHTGHEVDCLIERGQSLFPIEIKAGLTISKSYIEGLTFWNKIAEAPASNSFVFYAGDQQTTWNDCNIVSWQSCAQVIDFVEHAPHYREQQIFSQWINKKAKKRTTKTKRRKKSTKKRTNTRKT
jgi:predicted AAA+ superfamily ATPase